jgi:hypothetical protein
VAAPPTTVITREGGYPVRRGPSLQSLKSLEYLYGGDQQIIARLLVRRRPTSPRPDPKTTGRLGGTTVKGGRRPSRSDAALDGREPGGRLEGGTRFGVSGMETTSEASRPWTRDRVADLYSVDRSRPDHDACMRIGGRSSGAAGPFWVAAQRAMYSGGSPPPRMSSADCRLPNCRSCWDCEGCMVKCRPGAA